MARYETVLSNPHTGERVVIRSNDPITFQSRIAKKRQLWADQQARSQAKAHKENALAEADGRTAEALRRIDECRNILRTGVEHMSKFDWGPYWAKQYDHQRFREYQPEPRPVRVRFFATVPKNSIWELLYPPRRRFRERLESLAQERFERAYLEYEKSEIERRATHQREENAFFDRQTAHNDNVSRYRGQFEDGVSSAVEDFLKQLLAKSEYPEGVELDYETRFDAATRTVALELELPPSEAIPSLTEVRYVQSRDEYSEKHLKKAEARELYNETIAQIVVRTIYEIFRALYTNRAETTKVAGVVTTIDPKTGLTARPCVVSVTAQKAYFMSLNLTRVSAQECLPGLHAIISGEFSDLNPVTPVDPSPSEIRREKHSSETEQPAWVSFTEPGDQRSRSPPGATHGVPRSQAPIRGEGGQRSGGRIRTPRPPDLRRRCRNRPRCRCESAPSEASDRSPAPRASQVARLLATSH